jgi:hypothetical protein
MRVAADVRDHVASSFFELMAPYLDEKLLRLSAGALVTAFGQGSASAVAVAAGLAVSTVCAGVRDVADESAPIDRVRRPGAGRRGIEQQCPGIWAALDALVEPEERGDPENPLRWTVKSTRVLAEELGRQGFAVSHTVVGKLLREHGFSLRGTAKVLEGRAEHGPDRDRQFRHINGTAKAFLAAGLPVVSVDTKKKEPVGNFDRPGATWRPYQDPVKVADHSFNVAGLTAIPYGVYDIGADAGFVNVGVSHDTPTFAVASIRRWWDTIGQDRYPGAGRLLVVADAGGSNAARSLVFKALLHQLAVDTGLEITVCHTPPGTSKWNKVEHRLFAQISSNWRGRPLTSLQTVVESISATTTRTGLTVTCVLDESDYPIGITCDPQHVRALPITHADFQGAWNYTIAPIPAAQRCTTRHRNHAERTGWAVWAERLMSAEVTGIPERAWEQLATKLHTARHGTGQSTPIKELMLAAVLHERHQLPVAQINRMMTPAMLRRDLADLVPLFAHHGHPITRAATRLMRLEQLLAFAPLLPHEDPTTHEAAT